MNPEQFRNYQAELGNMTHAETARLLGVAEIGVKRYATGSRPIPEYIAQSLRAMVLLNREGLFEKMAEMP